MKQHPVAQAGLIVTVFLATSSPGHSHHSFFAYDDSQLVDVQGEVTAVIWRNPHVRFTISATAATGQQELWEIEGDSVNTMERSGFDVDTLEIGDNVKIMGLATTRDENLMRPVYMTLANGQNLVLDKIVAETFGLELETTELVAQAADSDKIETAARQANGIFRVWTNRGWSQDSREWTVKDRPLTDTARIARDAWDQATDDLAGRCIPAGMPEAIMNPFPIQFTEQGNDIRLRIEEWDNNRTIHMENSGDVTDQPASPLGYSIGHWEGNTLVVRTSRINYPFFDDRGTPQSDAVEILERFTLAADETRLDWEATVVDPETFTEPVVMPELHWEWVPGEELRNYNCTVSEE
jgi:hypothetical protein